MREVGSIGSVYSVGADQKSSRFTVDEDHKVSSFVRYCPHRGTWIRSQRSETINSLGGGGQVKIPEVQTTELVFAVVHQRNLECVRYHPKQKIPLITRDDYK